MTYEAFLAHSQQRLLRLAMVLTSDRHLSEELVSETCVRLFERWNRVCSLQSPHAYARAVLVNLHLSNARKSILVVPLDQQMLDVVVPSASLEDEYLSRQTLLREVDALPPSQRVVVVLRFYEDLSTRDIAQMLHRRESTVRSQIARALAALKITPGVQEMAGRTRT